MTKEDIQFDIETLESQISRCDIKIKKKQEEVELYHKNAQHCDEMAAKGGDIAQEAEDFVRGAREWREKASNILKYDIPEIEKEKESYIRKIADCRKMLSELGESDPMYSSNFGSTNNHHTYHKADSYKAPPPKPSPKRNGKKKRYMFEWKYVQALFVYALVAYFVKKALNTVSANLGNTFVFTPLVIAIPIVYVVMTYCILNRNTKSNAKRVLKYLEKKKLFTAYNYIVGLIVLGIVQGDSISEIIFGIFIVGVISEWIRTKYYNFRGRV